MLLTLQRSARQPTPRTTGGEARRSRPTDRRQVLEVLPEDQFLTYGLGVSLMQMRSPSAARARLPVGTPQTHANAEAP